MLLRNTVKFTQVALGLVPEVLDAVDVVFTVGKEFGVIDAQMPNPSRKYLYYPIVDSSHY